MATEAQESTTETTSVPESPAIQGPHRPARRPLRFRKSVIAAGSLGIFAAGLLLGMGVTHYATGIPSAAAATKTAKTRAVLERQGKADGESDASNPFPEIRGMQRDMDQMFEQMVADLHRKPLLSQFTEGSAGYSLSLRLKDAKDHYEVRARLPENGLSNVSVSLLDDRTLKVEVEDEATEKARATDTTGAQEETEWRQYEQLLELPGPVKSKDLRIDQAKGRLLITLPKA